MNTKPAIEAVLFDLDGTLLDTAQDLILALHSLANTSPALTVTKNDAYSLAELRAAAGRGGRGLLKTGLNIEHDDARYPALVEQLFAHYQDHLLDNTTLFPGIKEVLDHLDQANIPWGIVTNKPDRFTQKIISGLPFARSAKCVISGDSLENRKPHPEPLLHACKLLQISPENCLYVGDSETDVIASKAAGLPSLVALYGYISETEKPSQWEADGYISHPKGLIDWLPHRLSKYSA